MKKMIFLSAVLLLVLAAGCGGQTAKRETLPESDVSETGEIGKETEEEMTDALAETETQEVSAYDDVFLSNLSEALQARWDVPSENTDDYEEMTLVEQAKDLKRFVDAESGILKDCRGEKFEDSHLQEYAIAYLNGLDQQSKLIEDIINGDIADETFSEEWHMSTLKRYEQICAINDNFELKLDRKYNYQMNSIYNYVYINKIGDKEFWEMLNAEDNAKWEYETEDDGKELITVHCTNNTEYEFNDLSVYCYVCDTKGNDDYTDNEELDFIEYVVGNWKPGEEVVMTFKRTSESRENEGYSLDF